jgi:FlaA1/EpsC-like NDP-sugar epimerase
MAAKPGSRMRRVSVRFGNVLGSQGSVIPVLQEQIRSKQRVTVTHPDITRFFMTIPEAVSLVLQGFTVGKDGEILVLEMGRPIRIVELARTLIRLCGKHEDDIEIVFTGLRPGEKLHEELFYDNEAGLTTECEKVMRTSGSILPWPALQQHLRELDDLVYSASDDVIRRKLGQIVPEFQYTEKPREAAAQIPALVSAPGLPIAATASAND